ncbi:MAG: MFS transporter [Actinomycetia bacterium]|nr:MFS transporter [Actinomycetes bacterium]
MTTPIAPLPRSARRLLGATTLSALGNGLVLPFLVVYLHDVRGLPTSVAGLVVAWQALVGFVLAPLGGALIDRVGPRPVLLVGPVLMAAGVVVMGLARTPGQAFAAASLLAVGSAGLWPGGATLMARLVSDEQRQRAFGIQFMLLNLGIGVGGLVAGLVVDVDRPRTFELLYFADAVTFLGFAAVIATMGGVGGPLPRTAGATDGGYREVLRDRAMLRIAVVSLVMLTCGYGAIEIGYPAFATQIADVSPRLVAFGFVGNTLTIVLGQLYVIRLLEGRSRSRTIALVGVVWALSWTLLGLSGLATQPVLVAALVLGTPVLFAVGETLWQPVLPALVNELAPDQLRGRYNALASLTWAVAGMLGPALAGLLIGAGQASTWVVLVVGGSLLASALALRLRRVLSPGQDGGRLAA